VDWLAGDCSAKSATPEMSRSPMRQRRSAAAVPMAARGSGEHPDPRTEAISASRTALRDGLCANFL